MKHGKGTALLKVLTFAKRCVYMKGVVKYIILDIACGTSFVIAVSLILLGSRYAVDFMAAANKYN